MGPLDFSCFLLASALAQNLLASPYYPTLSYWLVCIGPTPHPSWGPASLLVPYLLPLTSPLEPPSQLTPMFAGPQSCWQAPGALTAGKTTEHQLEGHENITQVVGLWYDLHAAVLGIIEDPSTLQVRIAQL